MGGALRSHNLIVATIAGVLGLLGVAAYAAYSNSTPNILLLPPLSVSVQPGQPDAAALFDRNTQTTIPAANASITAELESATEIRLIKLHGITPYTLDVKAWVAGNWTPVAGLQNQDLSKQSNGWNTYIPTQIVTTNRLLFVLKANPPKGGKTPTPAELAEIEIWGIATHGLLSAVTPTSAQLAAVLQQTPITQLRQYAATPLEGVVGAAGATFNFTLERRPDDFKRAWLAYDSYGVNHWINPVRGINDHATLGGAFIFAASSWSAQQEPIHPAWLQSGNNRITFSLPPGAAGGSYSVRNVRVIAELEDGNSAMLGAQDTTPGISAANANVPQLSDGDLSSGWSPFGGAAKHTLSERPQITLTLDRTTQMDSLSLNLAGIIDSTMTVEARVNGAWENAISNSINLRQFGTGWNTLEISNKVVADALRLTFLNASQSSGELREALIAGSGSGIPYTPRIQVDYPDKGQYYGRQAYIRGFLTALNSSSSPDNGSGKPAFTIGGKTVTTADGAFGVLVSKEDVGLAKQATSTPWQVELVATYPNGQKITKTVYLTDGRDAADAQGKLTGGGNGFTQKISVAGALLAIDPGALNDDQVIKIKPLSQAPTS